MGGIFVLSRSVRCVLTQSGRLGDGKSFAHGACTRSAAKCHLSTSAARCDPSLRSRLPARTQPVVATRFRCFDLSTSLIASAGVRHSSVLRGRVLSVSATDARSLGLCILRSVPFGKYCRSKPLVFSFVPRCQGLCGSQKYTFTFVATVKVLCLAISSPPSQVNER